jgi:hypothetical protein
VTLCLLVSPADVSELLRSFVLSRPVYQQTLHNVPEAANLPAIPLRKSPVLLRSSYITNHQLPGLQPHAFVSLRKRMRVEQQKLYFLTLQTPVKSHLPFASIIRRFNVMGPCIVSIFQYTECLRRNVPNFTKVFLMLKYTDITQNTYIQSWTVTEIMAREKCGLLAVPPTVPVKLTRYSYTAHVRP